MSQVLYVLYAQTKALANLNWLKSTKFLPQIIIQSDHWKFQIFSRFISVYWSLICEDSFHH